MRVKTIEQWGWAIFGMIMSLIIVRVFLESVAKWGPGPVDDFGNEVLGWTGLRT